MITNCHQVWKAEMAEREVERQSSLNRGLTGPYEEHGTGASLRISSVSNYSGSLYSVCWAVKPIKLQLSAVVLAATWYLDWECFRVRATPSGSCLPLTPIVYLHFPSLQEPQRISFKDFIQSLWLSSMRRLAQHKLSSHYWNLIIFIFKIQIEKLTKCWNGRDFKRLFNKPFFRKSDQDYTGGNSPPAEDHLIIFWPTPLLVKGPFCNLLPTLVPKGVYNLVKGSR